MKPLDCTNPFGAPVFHEETVSSTMDVARLLARAGEPHGTVILADYQEAGRGRVRRPWLMEKGRNLSFTILLRYADFSVLPEALTLKAGLAVSEAVGDFVPPLADLARVKWPNDVMLSAPKTEAAHKVAGILTEAEGPLVFIGIGVNLAQRDFPGELGGKAGSLLSVLEELFPGEEPPPALLAPGAPALFLEKVLARLKAELEGEAPPWRPRLEDRLFRRGEEVLFVEGPADSGRLVEGRLAGIGKGGELLIVPRGTGEARAFVTGELRVYHQG